MEESSSHSESVGSPENAFKRTPLLDNDKQIRLLRMRPIVEGDVPRCHLESFPTDSLPEYIALSYRWGDIDDKFTIHIADKVLQAPSNAGSALQYINLPAETYIWIDAICIDQNNIEERNAQVAIMGTIYSQASEVLVWLGIADSLRAVACDIVSGVISENITAEETQAVMNLLNDEYWSRTWIIQEVLLAKKLTLTCGRHRIPWRQFERLIEPTESWREKDPTAGRAWYTKAATLVNARNKYSEHMRFVGTYENLDLAEFLNPHHASRCYDARDKIFGLLGAFNLRARQPFRIDYAMGKYELLLTCLAQ